MQIPSLKLRIYKFHNWAASYTLIYPDATIFSMVVPLSSVICIYSYIVLICCSLEYLDGFTLCTYYDTKLLSLEGLTEIIADGNFEGLLLGDWLVSVVGLVIGFNKGAVIGSWYGKVLVTTLGDLVGL